MLKFEKVGLIDLLFADESGFSLEPSIPYGWLPVGKQVKIPSEHKFVGNVFGLLSCNGHGQMHWTHQRINSEFVAKSLDQLSEHIQKPTVVVLDNAPWHRSALIKEKLPFWRSQNLYVFYLPPYSPQLNMIEIYWRHLLTAVRFAIPDGIMATCCHVTIYQRIH